MVDHLRNKAIELHRSFLSYGNSKVVLDIASNDGTLLREFSKIDSSLSLVGCDPLLDNFDNCYPNNAIKLRHFFEVNHIPKFLVGQIDLITSLSVYYDVDNPIKFAIDVWNSLKPGALWHLEQSYCLSMFRQNSFDTICHEHILYLKLNDFANIFNQVGFSVVSVELNDINGGSVALTVRKCDPSRIVHSVEFLEMLSSEKIALQEWESEIHLFSSRVQSLLQTLRALISKEIKRGTQVYALGASTKGNIILSAARLDNSMIRAIGDINPKKIGRVTPGTRIPIIGEEEVLRNNPKETSLLILPWHFRRTFIERTSEFRSSGGKVIFPLPEPKVMFD
jgi:hypothetical protein